MNGDYISVVRQAWFTGNSG